MDEFVLGMIVGIILAVAVGVFIEPRRLNDVLRGGLNGEKKAKSV